MARVLGAVLLGVDGVPVEVEVRIHAQLPRVDIVGLPEAAVRESAARVRAAIAAAGHRFPERRVIVNLAPASVRKQ
jgi:magnesium chelatase family protein